MAPSTDPHEQRIGQVEEILNYTFSNKLLCLEALQTTPYGIIYQGNGCCLRKNENLAIIGDAILKFILCQRWYATGKSKGQWSVAEQVLVSNQNLAEIGRRFGLDKCVILNPGTHVVSVYSMATAVEALLGAVHQDGGEKEVARILDRFGMDHENLRP